MTYGLPDSIVIGTFRSITHTVNHIFPMNPSGGGGGGGNSGGMNFSFYFKDVILYPGAMDELLKQPQGDVGKYLRTRARWIVAAAKAQVGVETGRLKASIHYTHMRDGRGQYMWIGSNEPHALMHHEGTKPHEIIPRTAPILRFTSGSRVVYTRHVDHPGTHPNKYLSDQLYLVRI